MTLKALVRPICMHCLVTKADNIYAVKSRNSPATYHQIGTPVLLENDV